MKVSYNWLSCYTELPLLEELADILIMLGFEVSSIEKANNDFILDLEVLLSRHDALSMVGLARDISAFTKKPLKFPEIPRLEEELNLIPEITIEEPLLCPRYTGRIISNIKVRESPAWIKERLLNCGIRPINNIVDITNYVLLELGCPMHSFDYDKLEGGIFVRSGKREERLLCLDGREYCLEDSVVISDAKKPIAIGGIIGGEETSVNSETKTILLEVAYFSPLAIRKASKRLRIITESSYRFERMVDPEGLIKAQNRAAGLILSLIPEAKIGTILDVYLKPFPKREITLRKERIDKILGIAIHKERIKEILEGLGFVIREKDKGFLVEIPSFRGEVTREIDLIEEIARIYGYEKINESMPQSAIVPNINENFRMVRKIREIMVGCGMDEVVAYSFTSKRSLERLKIPLENIVSLPSPLSKDTEIMTPCLILPLLEIAKTNASRDQADLSIFQMGKVFKKNREWMSLSGLMSGKMRKNWMDKERDFTFFDLLGVIKRLFLELGIESNFIKAEIPFLRDGLEIVSGDYKLGMAGSLLPDIGIYYEIKKPIFLFELDMDRIISLATKKVFKEFSKYPKIKIDLCLLAPYHIKSAKIEETIRNVGKGLVQDISLYDIYQGGNIPKEHKSLTYRITYQSNDRTLTMDEIEKIRDDTIRALQDNLSVSLRS